jgi:hypothetical protein
MKLRGLSPNSYTFMCLWASIIFPESSSSQKPILMQDRWWAYMNRSQNNNLEIVTEAARSFFSGSTHNRIFFAMQ